MSDEDFTHPVTIMVDGKERYFDNFDPKLPAWGEVEAFRSDDYPYKEKLKRSKYEDELAALQLELVKMQAWQEKTGQRIVCVFEGRDAAGKGGTIGAFRQYMNPRRARIVALPKPSDRERGEWYYQRYFAHFPTSGEIILFDRSWYNRAGVELVMGFCKPEQTWKFLDETPKIEAAMVREGIQLHKFWLNVGQEMQLERFHDRRHSKLKSWKLSSMDMKALERWDDYTNARNAMMVATHTDAAPWTIVKSNDKRRARRYAIRSVLSVTPYDGRDDDLENQIDDKVLGYGPDFLGL